MNLKTFSVNDPGIKEFFEKEGFVVFNDLFPLKDIQNIQNDFFLMTESLIKKYSIEINETDRESRAFKVFSSKKLLRKNIYLLAQELRSITKLVGFDTLTKILKLQNLSVPVLRNQALRIDFAEEPQFLQGIHQDVRGMRSSNCVNFWIPLQNVNEDKGTLSVFPKSHLVGGIKPTSINESGYQIFTDKDVAQFEKVILELPQGNCIMFHPYLYHGSVAAKTKALRLTVTLRFDDVCDMDWLNSDSPSFSDLDIQEKGRFS